MILRVLGIYIIFTLFCVFIPTSEAEAKIRVSTANFKVKESKLNAYLRFDNLPLKDFQRALDNGLTQRVIFDIDLSTRNKTLVTKRFSYRFYFDLWDERYILIQNQKRRSFLTVEGLLSELSTLQLYFDEFSISKLARLRVRIYLNPLENQTKEKIKSYISKRYKADESIRGRGIFGSIIELFSFENSRDKPITLEIPVRVDQNKDKKSP